MRNTNKKKLFLTETIKASDAYTDLNSFKTLEQEKRGIAWIQINLINNMEKKYIINSINNNDFGYVVVKEHPNKPIIVYRKGYRENAEELAKIASKYNGYLSGKATYEDSKRIGELLEYDPKDIQSYLSKNYKINNITEAENPKKKLFTPRGLSDDSDNRYYKHNKEQPIKDGVRINQYDINGRKEGYWEEYYDNGQLYDKGTYKDGRRDGYWEEYYDNGQLYDKGTYKDGKKQGYWEYYWSNGELNYKGTYKNGKEEGYWEYYWTNGQLTYKGTYKNGKEIKNMTESETPSFLLKEEIILIREGNVQDYINNVLTKIKNLPYETKKKYITIAISTLLGYTSYPIIQSIVDNSPDKEAKEITDKIIKEKGNLSTFKDGTKLRLSKKGFQHIIDEEKPKLIAYNLGDGKITIGYGHAEPINNTKLKVGDKITIEQAKKYLKEDLKTAADGVRRMFSDWKQQGKNYKVTQDMFDALVSMAFNMGVSGLRQSQMIQYLKQGKYKTAGQLIKQTNIDPDTFPGLEKRRYRESDMFLSYLSKPVDINA